MSITNNIREGGGLPLLDLLLDDGVEGVFVLPEFVLGLLRSDLRSLGVNFLWLRLLLALELSPLYSAILKVRGRKLRLTDSNIWNICHC